MNWNERTLAPALGGNINAQFACTMEARFQIYLKTQFRDYEKSDQSLYQIYIENIFGIDNKELNSKIKSLLFEYNQNYCSNNLDKIDKRK